jgi:hypothetical protein
MNAARLHVDHIAGAEDDEPRVSAPGFVFRLFNVIPSALIASSERRRR